MIANPKQKRRGQEQPLKKEQALKMCAIPKACGRFRKESRPHLLQYLNQSSAVRFRHCQKSCITTLSNCFGVQGRRSASKHLLRLRTA
jgi:hypothetical protein